MTQEEPNLLVENNQMLKQLMYYIYQKNTQPINFGEFAMNVLANMISNPGSRL